MKGGYVPLGVTTGAISAVTVLQRTGRVPLAALAPSPGAFGAGRVWLVATSFLVADRPAVPSIVGVAVVGVAALVLCGPRVVWLSAACGHVGSALAVYAGIALVRVVDPGALERLISVVDYGTSAIIAAWIGVVAYRLWRRDRRLSIGLVTVSSSIGALLRPDLTLLDLEHAVALGVGVATAHYAPRFDYRAVFRTRRKPATVSAPLSTRRHIQP